MSLPKPTYEELLKVIDELNSRSDGYSCCRNCYSITSDYECCAKCGLWRCDECRPIHLAMRDRLAIYLCLEMDVGYSVIDSFLHAYQVDVRYCSTCETPFCTRCRDIHHREIVIKGKFIYERYECDECFSLCNSDNLD